MPEPLPILNGAIEGQSCGDECGGQCRRKAAGAAHPSPGPPATRPQCAVLSGCGSQASGNPATARGASGASGANGARDDGGSSDSQPTFHGEHEQQLATLGSLVASIAHEINNILTPIASYADLARMHPDDSELAAKALQRAAAGARQASEIATAILSLATPDRGDAPSHCDDLRDIIHRSTLCLGSEPARLGVKVTWESAQGLALAMPAVALQHVLVNLLINAMRASKRGGVIEVSGGAGSTWNLAEITVRDAGEGIEESRRDGIFRDFESGCGSTGLGLAICRRLLEKWGGTIRVAETGPGGTVFAVTAPIVAASQQHAA